MRIFTHVLLAGIVSLLGGCVVVPYQPPAETKLEVTEVPHPERVRLTIGPGDFLKKLARETLQLDQRLTQIDTQPFIDTASPGGKLTLAGLLDPSTRARIATLQVDYLVVLGQPKDETLSKKGDMVFYGGFYGLRKSKDSTTNWAAVIDLRELRLVEQLTSKSTGTTVGAGLFYGLFIVSNTDGAARKEMIQNIIRTLAKARPTGPVRIVFVAEDRILTPEELPKREPPASWSVQQYARFVAAAPPGEGQGLVYFYRESGAPWPLPLHMNHSAAAQADSLLADFQAGGYYPLYAPAGMLGAWVESDGKRAAVAIDVEPGQTYYVKLTSRMGWREPRARLSVVDSENAQKEMSANCRLQPTAGEAAQQTRRFAEEGWPQRQFELGSLYESGVRYPDGRESLPKDYVEAYKWWKVAETDKSLVRNAARRRRDALAAKMDSAQIAEAELRADGWIAAHAAAAP